MFDLDPDYLWKDFGLEVDHVSATSDAVYVVKKDQLWKINPEMEGDWQHVSTNTSVKLVSTSLSQVWIVAGNQNVYRLENTTQAWKHVPQHMAKVSVGIQKTYGIDTDSNLYERNTNDIESDWTQISPGTFHQISVGENNTALGIDNKYRMCKIEGGGRSARILRYNGTFQQVSVGKDRVWGIDMEQRLMFCKHPCRGKWKDTRERFRWISGEWNRHPFGIDIRGRLRRGDPIRRASGFRKMIKCFGGKNPSATNLTE